MTKDKQVTLQCPNCGQYKVTKRSSSTFGAGLITFFVGFPALALFGIGIAMIFVGIIAMIVSPFLKGYSCHNCKWRGETLDLQQPVDPTAMPKGQA